MTIVDRQVEAGERRWRRFFGADGVVERYERRGDCLVQFGDIAGWLASNGLSRGAAIDRFVLAAKHGIFGWRDYGPRRRGVASLIDLDGREFPPGQYPLRPSALTVERRPELMRALRSVWAEWLRSEGWPMPEWLACSVSREDRPQALLRGFRTNHEAEAEEAARKWLQAQTRNGNPKRLKDDVFAELRQRAPLLTPTAFKRAWRDTAPPAWKRPGRPKKTPPLENKTP
jgi:hypothetical protein